MRRLIPWVLLLAAACDGEDERPATWSYIAATIVEPSCGTAACHSTWSSTYGLRLDTREGAYQGLVGGGYVVPGQPDASMLMYLLRGEDVATRMPPDLPLSDADIELIRRWILAGAKDD